jgi:hypothetical protein
MFTVCFVDHEPPNEREIDHQRPHFIQRGDSEHYLKIISNEGTELSRCNVRFIDLQELSQESYEPLVDIQHIIRIEGLQICLEASFLVSM